MLRHLNTAGVALAAALLLASAPAGAQNDTLTMGQALEPPHLDPTAGAAAAIDEIVYANVFEGLTRIDRTGAVQPALAKDWTVSDDGTVYTFDLRQDVTFHDGTSFEASDVVFSLDRARAEDSVNAQKQLFEPIESVTAVDPHTVRITLTHPESRFLFNLGWGDAVIVAPESADTNKSEPVGTGPFTFERWVKGDRVELARYDGYWGEAPALAAATFKFIPDPSAAMSALMAGDVDAFANFPSPESLQRFQSDPRFDAVVGTTEGETILAMNNAREPFDQLKVRRAISYAVDRTALIDGAQFGYGTPIGSHFAPHHPAYVDLTDRYPHDPEKAKTLLAEAGYPDGFDATIKLPPPTYARRGGEIVAAQLAEVGIELEIVPMEWAQWLSEVFKNTGYDLTIVSHTEPLDIGIYARDNYYFNYDNSSFDQLMDRITRTTDTEKRYELYAEAQRMLAEDAVNGFLFQLPKLGVWKAGVEGLWHDSPVQANDLTDVRWSQ